jgi:beta-phosphoglucomutase-like phosphatase (HAD superfamily)
VAVEDNPGGVKAAVSAGIACVAFPNENTAQLDFGSADRVVERLSFNVLGSR